MLVKCPKCERERARLEAEALAPKNYCEGLSFASQDYIGGDMRTKTIVSKTVT